MWWHPTPDNRFRRAKYRAWFACLDVNRTGELTWEDFNLLARRLQRTFEWGVDSAAHRRIVDSCQALWQALLGGMDEDIDGTVRLDEFIGFHLALDEEIRRRSGGVPAWALAPVKAIFAALDLDGDGGITLDEYSRYLTSIDASVDPAAAFARLDLDGNGILDLEEIEQLYVQWVTAGDDGAPGNVLLTGSAPR